MKIWIDSDNATKQYMDSLAKPEQDKLAKILIKLFGTDKQALPIWTVIRQKHDNYINHRTGDNNNETETQSNN